MIFARVLGRLFSLPLLFLRYTLIPRARDATGVLRPINNPMRLKGALEDLSGIFIKFGELLAMRFDLLPPPYAIELLNLRQKTRALPAEKLFAIFVSF